MIRQSHDTEHRKKLAELRHEIRLIEKPAKDVDRKKARQERRERVKAIGKPATGQRQPRERDAGFLAWVRRLPCMAGAIEGGCEGSVQAAHLRFSDAAKGRINSGLQSKPSDKWATPLCASHHLHDQHSAAERAFWERLGVDPGDLCMALYAAYLADEDGAAVVLRFANERSEYK